MDHTNPPVTVEQAEETLRLLAQVREPDGLQDRIHARLAAARVEESDTRPGLFARLGISGGMGLRLAVAAGCLAVVALVVEFAFPHRYNGLPAQTASHGPVLPAQAPAPTSPTQDASGGFRTSGAQRVPPTLTPLHVAPVPKKRLHSGKAGAPKATTAKPAVSRPQPAAIAGPAQQP